jgi:hypothetical protein
VGTEQTSQDPATVAGQEHAHVRQAGIVEALALSGPHQSMLFE